MTTMFDAPMHDFSTESAMDADMVPSAASDADWLQVESMMEDGDAQKPSPEVDMSHGDVQEFEMRDAGDADTGYGGDFDQMLPEGHVFTAEPQDQEIPDASRAPSPSTLMSSSQPQALTISMRSDLVQEEHSKEQDPQGGATQSSAADPYTSHVNGEGGEAPSTDSPHVADELVSPEQIVDAPAGDVQDTSTISGESNRSPELQQYDTRTLETSEHDDPAEESTEPSRVDQNEGTQEEEYFRAEGNDEGVESEARAEVSAETQVTEADDEGLIMDPPPTVLLSYPFDNTRFAFFNLPEDSHGASVPVVSTPEASSATNDHTAESETKGKEITSEDHSAPTESQDYARSEALVLLFQERFALYYEPLSLVFEALRSDETINLDGRFDDNIELVISAPELDLTLPEDNTYSREVSLHDLGVLHNGCDLNGPLSLRLDTISPRFGTRYKAIRDAIVRVVSLQGEEEERSQLEPEDGYVDGAPFHDSRDSVVQDQESHESNPGLDEITGDDNAQSSEQHPASAQDSAPEPNALDSEKVEEEEEEADTYEDSTSGEYVEYDEFAEVQAGGGVEESYEDAEGDFTAGGEIVEVSYEGAEEQYYVEESEQQPGESQSVPKEVHVVSLDAADADASLDAIGEVFDDIYESATVSAGGQTSAAATSKKREGTTSTQRVDLEDLLDLQASTFGALTNNLPDTSEPDTNDEVALHEFVSLADISANAEPLLLGTRSRSRSGTPRPSNDIAHNQDEVIAYEDTVEDEVAPVQQSSSQTNASDNGSRAVSTASKRSYDEHELDQLDSEGPERRASNESKRLRVD